MMETDDLGFEDLADERLNQVSYSIIGAAIAVHRKLGPGHSESIYENALAVEFSRRGIRFERQFTYKVMYEGEFVGEGRLDFLVEDLVVLEIKATQEIHPVFRSQVISYLKATGKKLGILINFNTRYLKDSVIRIAN